MNTKSAIASKKADYGIDAPGVVRNLALMGVGEVGNTMVNG